MNDDEPETAPLPGDDGDAAPMADARRYPSTVGGTFYLLILATMVLGIVVVAVNDWRIGVRILACALGAAAGLRLLLPQRDAGMLAVRHRLIDVFMLAGVAAALYFLAGSIPNQPGM